MRYATRRTKPINVIKGFSTSICACVWSEKQVNHHHHHQQRVFLSVDNLFIFSDGILWSMILISHDLPTKMFDTHLKTKTTTTIKKKKKSQNIQECKKNSNGTGVRARALAQGVSIHDQIFFFFFGFWVCR